MLQGCNQKKKKKKEKKKKHLGPVQTFPQMGPVRPGKKEGGGSTKQADKLCWGWPTLQID